MKLVKKMTGYVSNMSYKALAFRASLPFILEEMANAASCTGSNGGQGGQGVGQLACNISGNFEGLGQMFMGGCFLGGMGLSGMGIMKLKQASEDGGRQVKYGEGVWRLGVGAGLVGLPAVAYATRSTLVGGGENSGGMSAEEEVNRDQF